MRTLQVCLVFTCFVTVLSAQKAVVTRNVNLRSDPSTDNPPVTKLTVGNQLDLLEPNPVNSYYHVKTGSGTTGFVWGRNVQIQPAGNSGANTPTGPAEPAGTTVASAPVPLLAKGHPVSWWFVFKFNSASFPKCSGTAQRACLFGGTVQSYPKFSQQFVYASSENHNLQQGVDCIGDTADDPLGATFDEVYNNSFHYVVWNDQFYDDPVIANCSQSCSAPWGHSKGLLAWNDAGEGLVLQVTTPSWPAAGSSQAPRNSDGNTLGCVKDNNVLVSQHFFALKLSKDDLVAILNGLRNASVVTDVNNPQIVSNGGPADVQQLVRDLGTQSDSNAFTKVLLSTGVQLITKPSRLHVPPWQMVSAVLGGTPLRTATWWAAPKIYTTATASAPACWDSTLGSPGSVEIATTGHWQGQEFGLSGSAAPNFNHAKIGISTSGTHEYAIFGDMNQQGSLNGPNCASSQNGRGGLFYVIDDAELAHGVSGLVTGSTAPTHAP